MQFVVQRAASRAAHHDLNQDRKRKLGLPPRPRPSVAGPQQIACKGDLLRKYHYKVSKASRDLEYDTEGSFIRQGSAQALGLELVLV